MSFHKYFPNKSFLCDRHYSLGSNQLSKFYAKRIPISTASVSVVENGKVEQGNLIETQYITYSFPGFPTYVYHKNDKYIQNLVEHQRWSLL